VNIIKRLIDGLSKSKRLLRQMPIRDRSSTIEEVKGWDSRYGFPPIEIVRIDKAAEILDEHLRNPSAGEFLHVEGDRIRLGYGSDSHSGHRTILRIGDDEFVVHRYASD